MTKTPPIVQAEIYTSMPDVFRKTGIRSQWADANRGGSPVDSFLEGPVFDQAGNLYVTDYKNDLMQIDIVSGAVEPYLYR